MFASWRRSVEKTVVVEEKTFLETQSTKPAKRFQGWRFGVLMCTTATCLVLLLNIVLALAALGKGGWGQDGQPILREGDCSMISMLSTGVHLLINAMSTALLGASSYCMQCLSAPTRKELDLAHKKQSWLDIGVLSPRNIRSVSRSRRVRWLILGLSTIPLHLVYNSVVFSSTGANLYYPLFVKEAILQSDSTILPYNMNSKPARYDQLLAMGNPNFNENDDDTYPWVQEAKRLRALHATGDLQRMENYDCLKAYATQFQRRGSLFLVTTNETFERNLISYLGGPWTSQKWICSDDTCEETFDTSNPVSQIWADPESWNFAEAKVAYCLSEKPQERCRLQLSLPLAIIVVFFNVVKAVCMVTMLLRLDKKMVDPPIMNIGDTVSSYLERSNPSTKNMGLATLNNLRVALNMSHRWDTRPKEFSGKRRLRFLAASKTRWGLTFMLYASLLSLAGLLAYISVAATSPSGESPGINSLAAMKSLGWGRPDTRTMIYSVTKDLVSNAMFANSPQLILSWVYFSYNGLLTLLATAREWESYALHRKGLRVSSGPQGEQRSKYFLSLPYRIALPFMGISALLHWLVSQSFFLVSVQAYRFDAVKGWIPAMDNAATRVSIGYSPLPMVVGVAVGGFLLVAIIVVGLTPFQTAMPVVSSCSAAMSAACQPTHEDDGDAATSAVQWGVMGRFPSGMEHVGFSGRNVHAPVVGRMYR